VASLARLGLARGSVDESTLLRVFARLDADLLDAVLGDLLLMVRVVVLEHVEANIWFREEPEQQRSSSGPAPGPFRFSRPSRT
jgi:hypothetical protein